MIHSVKVLVDEKYVFIYYGFSNFSLLRREMMEVIVHNWNGVRPKFDNSNWGVEIDVKVGDGIISQYDGTELDILDILQQIPGEVVLDVSNRKELKGMQGILEPLISGGNDLARLTILSDSSLYQHFAMHDSTPLSLSHFGFPISKVRGPEDIGALKNIVWVPGIEDTRSLAEALRDLAFRVKVFYLLDQNLPKTSPDGILDQFFNDVLVFHELGLVAPIPICDLEYAGIISNTVH